jgi:hypothetical protein
MMMMMLMRTSPENIDKNLELRITTLQIPSFTKSRLEGFHVVFRPSVSALQLA